MNLGRAGRARSKENLFAKKLGAPQGGGGAFPDSILRLPDSPILALLVNAIPDSVAMLYGNFQIFPRLRRGVQLLRSCAQKSRLWARADGGPGPIPDSSMSLISRARFPIL
jgi:hypothetical protein